MGRRWTTGMLAGLLSLGGCSIGPIESPLAGRNLGAELFGSGPSPVPPVVAIAASASPAVASPGAVAGGPSPGDAASPPALLPSVAAIAPTLLPSVTASPSPTPSLPAPAATPGVPGPTPSPAPTVAVSAAPGEQQGPFTHYTLERMAGSAIGGTATGSSPANATFMEIGGLLLKPDGSLVVSDPWSNQVRLIASGGPASLLAGSHYTSGGFSGDGGPANMAELSQPHGLALMPDGALLVADSGNGRIRRITPDGMIDTFAGGGTDNGDTVSDKLKAGLDRPESLALDDDGTLYVGEAGSGYVRRISPTGAVTTLALLTPGEQHPLALDRAHHVLWTMDVSSIRAITAANDHAALSTAPVWTPPKGISYPAATALCYDQQGTLYALTGSTPTGLPPWGVADAHIWVMGVNMDGSQDASRPPRILAGSGGQSGVNQDYAVGDAAVSDPTQQLMTGQGWHSLAIAPNGTLFWGNAYFGHWGQVLRLDPAP